MIGHMQGKFQLVVVPGIGHMLHEVRQPSSFFSEIICILNVGHQDNPTRLAEIMVEFWRRNERVMVGVRKVGEL